MLQPILGTQDSERVLVFILARREGFASQIADFFNATYTGIRRQLIRLEEGGVLFSKRRGATLFYEFNPRYPFLLELESLLKKAVEFYPKEIRQNLYLQRSRPRKADKPL